MSALAAGVMVCIVLVAVVPVALLVGDHRSGRHPIGPVVRAVGTALSVAAVLAGSIVVGGVLGSLLALVLADLTG
jgi:hypothetical protein